MDSSEKALIQRVRERIWKEGRGAEAYALHIIFHEICGEWMQEWSLTSILQLSQPEEEAVEQVLPAIEPSSLSHLCKWAEERHDRIRWVITRRSKGGRSFGV
ncbi:hypothetical protein CAPTEDRAFT_207421 [Capitella teleta]|uniref:Uncharacterized protein n=1 Tax=Capitella teleta TaxID=283909 RepID=R7UJC1_CAPTE|nr:hypothetical protein CAPTEDRAFT_207421 [Capitella teleta]|eukprot:ELU06305.1 hypothetical protein CAPTEDRAFT_207421 [Capitella teleta]